MKKQLIYTLSLLFVALLTFVAVSCDNKKQTEAVRDAAVDSLQRVIDQKDNELNDFVGVFNEIQEGFRLIEAAENNVAVVRDGENTNKAEQIRESIRNIQQRMQHNRELIENLHDENGYGKFIVLEMKDRFDSLDENDKMKVIDTLSATTKANQRWAEGKRKQMKSDK